MENQRLTKGIWIPIEIWKDKNLTWNEKILFLEIDSFTSVDKDCYFSNEYISEILGVSETNANKILSSLIKKGYVVKTKFDGRHRYVKTALSYTTTQTCNNYNAGLSEETSQGCQYRQCCIAADDNHNNTYNNQTNKKEKEDIPSSSKKKKKSSVPTTFVPPTLEEVQAYIKEKGYDVDAKYFIDYYEAGDWRCGKEKNKMKSWKQAVVTWQNNNEYKKSSGETNIEVDELFYECWKAYGEVGSEVKAKAEWIKLSEKEKTIICRHIEQYTHVTEICYRKNFENYIGQKEYKNIVRRKNIVIFEPTKGEADNYYPFTDIGFSWNEYYNHFLYIGYDVQNIADGYTNEDRPHGATVMANNGRGVFKWDSQKKEWVKEEYFDMPF